MADNVAVTAGSGTTIAADELTDGTLGTVKVQYVKIMDGTLDSSTKAAVTGAGLKVDLSGTTANATAVKVDGSAVTQPVSGTVTANIGTAGTLALDATLTGGTAKTKLVDTGGTNVGTIKAASTAAIATDTALVVAVSPNNTVAATQSGTWTVQPGNTANTTAWKVQLYDGTTALPVLAGSSGPPAASAPALAVSVRDANANGQTTMASSAPVVIASDQSSIKTIAQTSTTGGATPQHYLSTASTNASSTKASAGTLYGVSAVNTTATVYYLKLYNKASAPTVGTDVPVLTFPVPASTSGAGINLMWPMGVAFGTGIAFAITGAAADADATAAATGVTVNLVYA